MRRPSLFGALGGAAVVVILVASLVVRSSPPADPAADVGEQRSAVTAFHRSVRAGRWADVYRLTAQPPTPDAAAFAKLMRRQVDRHGTVRAIEIDGLRLLRSRPTPLLEVRETVTIAKDGERRTTRTVSYFTRTDDRWLFAFSAPGEPKS